MYKECKQCEQTKHITDFYLHNGMTSGRLSFCKECVKTRVKTHAHTEHSRKLSREWFRTEKGKAKLKRHMLRYRRLYPEKYKAHKIAGNALRNGTLTKEPCEVCGVREVEKHHEDYSKPLDVRWLCRKHHRLIPF